MNTAKVDLMNGNQAQGQFAANIMQQGNRLDVGKMRPFLAEDKYGNVGAYMSVYVKGDPNKNESYRVVPLNVNGLQFNSTLRRDEWKELDEAIMMVSRDRLVAVEDLRSRGLTKPLGNAMGTTVLEWHDRNDPMEAAVDMNATTRTQGDTVNYQYNYLPIPIIHSDYDIDARHLEASRRLGNPLSTDDAESASRRVNEKLEDMLVTNTTFSFGAADERGRNTIYSYINHPDRIQQTLSVAWDDSAKSATDIKDDVNAMIQASVNAKKYGPWVLYVPKAYRSVLDDDYKTTSAGMSQTIRNRLLQLDGLEDIKIIDRLPDDNVLLVEMNSQTVRLIDGIGLTNVQWQEHGGFVNKFKVFQIQVPQIRSDQNNKTGIVHLA